MYKLSDSPVSKYPNLLGLGSFSFFTVKDTAGYRQDWWKSCRKELSGTFLRGVGPCR